MNIKINIMNFYITTFNLIRKKMKFANNLTELIGNTPLVKLQASKVMQVILQQY